MLATKTFSLLMIWMEYLMNWSNQLLEQSDIPQYVWQSAKEKSDGDESEESTSIRMDVRWAFLSSATTGDGCRLKFARLLKVARLILVLPYSNAGEERIFSMVRLNKTP